MSAKHKLNTANFYGAMIIAGLLAWVTESLVVFLVTLIGLLLASYYVGDIRR